MHYAMIIKENSEQNLDIWPNLTCFFRSWWFSVLTLGRLCFGFDVTTIYSWFVTSYNLFKQIWILVDVIQDSLSDGHATGFLSKFSNFRTNFAATRFRPKISKKIAWHEPTDMSTSSAISLIVIRRFYITIFYTASVFSLIVDVLGRPGRASSFTSSRPSVKSLYHL